MAVTMQRLRKVAETLAAHGQHDLAREVASVSLAIRQAAENNPVLLQMNSDLQKSLVSVRKALKALKASPKAKAHPGSVVPTAINRLTQLQEALMGVTGKDSPFIWNLIDLD